MLDVSRELYPFTSRRVAIRGLDMHYVDEGQGHPVVMVHGNPTWSFYWRNLIKALSPHARAIAADHIGMGYSARPSREQYPFTLARRVEDFGAFIDSLDLQEPLTLVVHDWGGMIGTAWAVGNLSRVKRMVVLNTAAFLLPPGKSLPLALAAARSKPIGEWAVRGANAFASLGTEVCVRRAPMRDDVRQGYLAPYDDWDERLGVYEFVNDIPLSPGDRSYDRVVQVTEQLGKLANTPMTLCWGGQDFVFHDAFLAEWRKHCPHADVHEFPDAGHYVMEDAEREIVALVRKLVVG